jgi:multimeric flavodoxin WrbA
MWGKKRLMTQKMASEAYKKVIVVNGSPRKGNTEWMLGKLDEVLNDSGVQTKTLFLRKLNIQLCTGCLTCEAGGVDRKGVCKLDDDMNFIYPELLEADGWIMGTPVYFEMVSGLLKSFMDRTCPIWTRLAGKKICGVAVAEGGIGKAIDNIKTYVGVCQMKYIGSVTTLAKTPKQASRNKNLAKRLERLAEKFVVALGEA